MSETTPKKQNIILRLLALLVTIALILGALVLVYFVVRSIVGVG